MNPPSLCCLLFFLCIACNKEDDHHITPILQPVVDNFFLEAQRQSHDIKNTNDFTVTFGDLSKEGKNARTYYETRTIVVDSSTAAYKRDPEVLVFHEMGHLLLHREHKDSFIYMDMYVPGYPVKVQLWVPESIMNCCLLPDYEFDDDARKLYMKELFSFANV